MVPMFRRWFRFVLVVVVVRLLKNRCCYQMKFQFVLVAVVRLLRTRCRMRSRRWPGRLFVVEAALVLILILQKRSQCLVLVVDVVI
jgi:hypothetical protein